MHEVSQSMRAHRASLASVGAFRCTLCQRLVGQFALWTFKRAQVGTSKAGLDTDQHHANLALDRRNPEYLRSRSSEMTQRNSEMTQRKIDLAENLR